MPNPRRRFPAQKTDEASSIPLFQSTSAPFQLRCCRQTDFGCPPGAGRASESG